MKSFKKFIASILLILFGFEISLDIIKTFTDTECSVLFSEKEEGKETENDDDKLEKEKYNLDNLLSNSISINSPSLIYFHSLTFINLIQPHLEVATPPPDFC